jgi:anthranilate synthase/aminodeoxychorismate synthase-like glutamine amidotransferase
MPHSIFIIDNYDSFTYNLVEAFRQLGVRKIKVKKHEKVHVSDVQLGQQLIFSPGPLLPKDHPILTDLLVAYASKLNILGVCLGHQAIGQWLGAELRQLSEIKHGIRVELKIQEEDPLFSGITEPLHVGLYHSWVVDLQTLPAHVRRLSITPDGKLMALHVPGTRVRGVQFHPESYMTDQGLCILENWLKIT